MAQMVKQKKYCFIDLLYDVLGGFVLLIYCTDYVNELFLLMNSFFSNHKPWLIQVSFIETYNVFEKPM